MKLPLHEISFVKATAPLSILANAVSVKYPAALQRCKVDIPLLAAGYLIFGGFSSRSLV